MEKILALEFCAAMLLLGLLLKRVVGAWSHPAVIFALFWTVMAGAPLAILWSVPVNPWSVAYLLAVVVAFGLPAFLIDWWPAIKVARARRGQPSGAYNNGFLFNLFLLMQLGTLACIVINLHLQGFSIDEFVQAPLQASRRYLTERYEGTITKNLFSQAGIILNYTAAGIAGLIIAKGRLLRKALIFSLAFIPSVLYMVLYADKGTLFLVAAYFFGGVIVRRLHVGDTSFINRATVLNGMAAVALVVPLVTFAMLARGSGQWSEGEQSDKVVYYLATYALGHVYAFSDWFGGYFFQQSAVAYTDPPWNTGGFWTFLAIGSPFSSQALPAGYFDEYVSYPGVLTSNIFTMFRGLIYDFGLAGSLMFMFVVGWLSSLAYHRLLTHPAPIISASFLIFLAGFIYSSYLLSLLTWASVYAAAAGITILLAANKLGDEWKQSYYTMDAVKRVTP